MRATDKSCENISDLLSIESTEIPRRQLNSYRTYFCVFVHVIVHVSRVHLRPEILLVSKKSYGNIKEISTYSF